MRGFSLFCWLCFLRVAAAELRLGEAARGKVGFLVGFSTRHRGNECCAAPGTVLGQHQVEADVGLHKLSDLLHHQIVEFRVETVHRTVNADLKIYQIEHWLMLALKQEF